MFRRTALVRGVALLLAVSFPAATFAADCPASKAAGAAAAEEEHSSSSWLAGGCGSNLCLWPFGPLFVTLSAALSNPTPDKVPEDSEIDPACFKEGYGRKAQRENMAAACLGGVLGTVLLVGIFFIALANGDVQIASAD